MAQHSERKCDLSDWQSHAAGAELFVRHLEKLAKASPSPAGKEKQKEKEDTEKLAAEEAAELKRALERLRPAFEELSK
jgi:hypothetical protein